MGSIFHATHRALDGFIPNDEVGGVPAFVGDAPASTGETVATIAFRVNECDEPLALHGLSRLVQYLVLGHLDSGVAGVEPHADAHTLGITIRGDRAAVASQLQRVGTALRTPDLDRLSDVASALRTAAARRALTVLGQSGYFRFGPTGYGIADLREFALEQPDGELVTSWIQRYFTRDNAVIWVSDPLDEPIDLGLSAGSRHAAPPARPLPEPMPTWTAGPDDAISLTVVADWRIEFEVAWHALRLDVEAGLARWPSRISAAVSPIEGGLTAHAELTLRANGRCTTEIRDHLMALVTRFCWDGPSDAALAAVKAEFATRFDGPDAELDEIGHRAAAWLVGTDAPPFDVLRDRTDALDLAGAAELVERSLDTAVWFVPTDLPIADRRYHRIPAWSRELLDGTPVDTLPGVSPTRRLIAAHHGLTMLTAPDRGITTRFAEIEAMVIFPSGARQIIGSDGFTMTVQPDQWPDGSGIIRWIDQQVSDDRKVFLSATR